MKKPWDLKYWDSGEWQVVEERLQDMEKAGVQFNPKKNLITKPLSDVPLGEARCAIIGQDPYPQAGYATGRAFSIPRTYTPGEFPPTLRTIFHEYSSDLHYPLPGHGDLSGWAAQGVILWNAIPTCRSGSSLSHDWVEYGELLREVVGKLSDRGIVFALLGSVARRALEYIDLSKNEVIMTSHPSPRGNLASKTPFTGSRLFTTINDKLVKLGLDPVDWRISDGDQDQGQDHSSVRGSGDLRDGSRILQNTTGADLGKVSDTRGLRIRK